MGPGVVWQTQRKDREALMMNQVSALTIVTSNSNWPHCAFRLEGGRECAVCRQTHRNSAQGRTRVERFEPQPTMHAR